MNTVKHHHYLISKSLLSRLMLSLMIGLSANISHATISQTPLFLTLSVTPIVMLNVSKDHQLYFKAFDDFSDLDKDGTPETTYKHGIDYYGYFDSYKCYSYNTTNNRFEPSSTTSTKYCTGLWSGNFLNWASMTRIDTIRKILYGGLRSTDIGSTTTTTSTTTPAVSTSTVSGTTTTSHPAPTKSGASPYTYTTTATKTLTSSTGCPSTPATVTSTLPSSSSGKAVYTYTFDYSTSSSTSSTNSTTSTAGSTTSTVNTATTSNITNTSTTTFTNVGSSNRLRTTSISYAPTGSCTTTDGVSSQNFIITMFVTSSEATVADMTVTTVTSTTPSTTTTISTTTTTATTSPSTPLTVLERSYLPNDAHSFAKFYNGSDLTQLTPFTSTDVASGVTLCNTTVSSTVLSQSVTDAPLIRIAKGNYSLWAANERWQCLWSEEQSASNSNSSTDSGISAASSNPDKATKGLGSKDYIAKVEVCDSSLIGTENCKTYPDGAIKPIGLLQTYGDDDKLRFGMVTGSFGKNKSGGVLRKNVSSIGDEIDVTTSGTFKSAPSTGGIIDTLNKLRIHGYRHDDGTYFGTTGSNNCTWGLNTFTDGNCSNWGNPQSEIFLESLRYLTNHSALNAYLPTSPNTDSSYIPGLTVATPINPISDTQWCAKLNVIQFNASTSSYDGDQLSNVADITATAMKDLTDPVGVGENIPGNSYFVGENGTINNQLCTEKIVDNLSNVRGTCPDAPRLSGSYHIAGLAQFAHNNDIQLTLEGDQLVTTYGVALSPAIPKIIVPVPDSATKTVTILPACQNSTVGGNCAIVDFKIVHQDCSLLSPAPSASNCGKVYVNWEDSEQGGDFDQDQWGVITYSVNSTQIKITTDVIAQSTPYKMGFGYVLSGTTKDGFHAHSGINSYTYTDPQGTAACSNCATANAASSETYTIGTSSALSLQQPLYYAAKWGGFTDSNSNSKPDLQNEWDSNGDGIPDRYFYATDPRELATSLSAAFANVVATSSSSSAVAANSTRLDTGTLVYQAKFNSGEWSGQLVAYSVNTSTGALTTVWEASTLLPAYGSRNIYTYDPSAAAGLHGVPFEWANLTATPVGASQQDYLNELAGISDGNAELRVNWLRGDDAKEQKNAGGIFRNRTNFLGDIINSDPVYVGIQDYGYSTLPGAEGASYSTFRSSSAYTTRRPMLYVGANDGMFHGFDAKSTGTGGQEIFAYIPNALFPELSKLTSPNYAHQYYVDGMSGVSDVYYDSAWHTLLAGTTGAGARAVFALDVTNPDGFSSSSALWEFTNANDADLGYTLAQPSVVRMQDGHWAVIVANGYSSDNGHAVLFVLDAKTGAVLQKIDTGVGTMTNQNGLSSPLAVDTNDDHSVDTVYAGDLYGNLWKFDVSGSAGSWPVPGSPFFVACTTSGTTCSTANRQPITGKPNVGLVGELGSDQNGVGRMIYFGTGKYFETGDNIIGDTPQVQTFYGLWDKGSAIIDRSLLQEQTIDFDSIATTVGGVPSTKPIRVVSKNPVCYAATSTGCTASSSLKTGWALNLLKPVNIALGELVDSYPLVRRGLVVFSTKIPNSDPCASGGKSRLMEVGALSGGEFSGPPFDVNGDGQVNNDDFVLINGVKHAVSGIDLGIGITKTPAVVEGSSVDFKYLSGSSGQMGTVNDAGSSGATSGGGGGGIRRSWRQLK
ncbi:type IV pilus assembly protein PilY1 [Methylobacter tundripaludum]|uniref:Type IV pilus assembly protein PilY1 n=1 Tax=Methylobacter tundripaludum TaxID=173365 RepID=A0A2S6GHG3_9GAMM|nr:PilC/PilY family type IV pilus protein [Methylobacter tundripaludum]PPK64586.1 type IV pilus assembly protein PilY1 [Methylobacter tundripaludum]